MTVFSQTTLIILGSQKMAFGGTGATNFARCEDHGTIQEHLGAQRRDHGVQAWIFIDLGGLRDLLLRAFLVLWI